MTNEKMLDLQQDQSLQETKRENQQESKQEMPEKKVTFESTPNPATMKFHFFRTVTDESFECLDAAEAERSPLAAKIFGFPWTASVFIGPDFMTISKHDWVEWSHLAQPLANLIQEHLDRGEPIFEVAAPKIFSPNDIKSTDSDVVKQIKNLLNREIRPAVSMDGGDIEFVSYEENIVLLKMKGACSGCPSSQATLKNGIEARLKQILPEIKEVRKI